MHSRRSHNESERKFARKYRADRSKPPSGAAKKAATGGNRCSTGGNRCGAGGKAFRCRSGKGDDNAAKLFLLRISKFQKGEK